MSEPRIILFDLETLVNLKEAMKFWPQLSNYPGQTLKAQITSVICFGWKVFGKNEPVNCINAWDYKNWDTDINDDYEVVKAGYDILRSADAVVTHNGKRFDWKFLQTRLIKHGLEPLHKIPHIDTCSVAKSNLMAFNNRLGNLSEFFGGEGKMENGGWSLWCKVMEKDPESMKLMSDYCKQDVVALEGLFRKLRPLTSNIPNHNHWNKSKKDVCDRCGSTRIKVEGYRYNKTTVRKRMKCKDCGGRMTTDATGKNPRSF